MVRKYVAQACLVVSSLLFLSIRAGQTLICPSHDIESKLDVLFLHGIVDNEEQVIDHIGQKVPGYAKRFPENNNFLYDLDRESVYSPSFFDAAKGVMKYIQARHSTLGQGVEIEHVKRVYDKYLKDKESVIIHGESRGGALGINFLARYNPHNTKALICSSSFDSVENFIYASRLPEAIRPLAYWFVCKVFNYKHDGEHPVEQIRYIQNKDLPVLVVGSKQDWMNRSRALYQAFIDNGFTHVQFLETNVGKHAKILFGPEGHRYQDAVQSLKEHVLANK